MTGAKCALILFFSVASNTFFTSLLDFLHIRKCALTVSAPADEREAHIRALTLVRIPAALDSRRRIPGATAAAARGNAAANILLDCVS